MKRKILSNFKFRIHSFIYLYVGLCVEYEDDIYIGIKLYSPRLRRIFIRSYSNIQLFITDSIYYAVNNTLFIFTKFVQLY